MARSNIAWLILVPVVTVAGVLFAVTAPEQDAEYKLVRTVVDVLAKVDESYVRKLTPEEKQKLVEQMINGGLEKLDPHSQYFAANDYAQFKTLADGEFGGVGVLISKDPKTGVLMVESPLPDSPAYEAGVLAGDLIAKVNGQSTEGLTIEDLRTAIKGEVGTPVTLNLVRLGASAPFDLVLKRAIVQIHPVKGFARNEADPTKWDWLADKKAGIALVRVTTFSEKTAEEVRRAVLEAQNAGARALVLDLRDNPGGLLTQAAAVSDLFLTGGPIVSTGDKRQGPNEPPRRVFEAKAQGTILEPAGEHPIAVLVNRQSASAAEIVAAALQDRGRAVVVGERTYGKGSVQKVFPLGEGNAAVKLTTEVWMTPSGKNLHRWPDSKESDDWGVKPDGGLEVTLTRDDLLAYVKHVRDLDRIRGKPGTTPMPPLQANPGDKPPDKPYRDSVLEKALGILRDKLAGVPGKPA